VLRAIVLQMIRVQLARPADATTLDSLWSELGGDLRRYVAKRVPEGAVDDLHQEIFARVLARREELRDSDRVAPWVFRIARSVVVDHLRARRVEVMDAEALAVQDEEGDADQSVRVLARWLAAMVSTLPEPYREAIELTELQGVAQAEAARRVGVSYSGFKSRVQRGRAKLREILQDCCAVELDVRGAVIDYQARCEKPDCC
jgi:RNA polymerase sigma-70 factor (ECF subfamily)